MGIKTSQQRFFIWATGLLIVIVGICLSPRLAIAATRPIALDCGHGGNDEGAVYGSFVERDMNWEITLACKAELERMGYRVVIVNTTSQNYDLDERVSRAFSNNCPVIISLHNNAWDRVSQEKRGATVLVPNASSYEKGLYDIGQRFAGTVTLGLSDELGMPLWKDGSYERDYPSGEWGSTYPDGSTADYYGIVRYARKQGIFGAIIEHGFIDNSDDQSIYTRSGALEQMGIVDAHAIAAHYDEFVSYADESQAAKIASGMWVSQNGKWWYRYADNTYPAGRVIEIRNATYGFDKNGWMVTGWHMFDDNWRWFGDSGAMARDCWTPDGCYVDENGIWVEGMHKETEEQQDEVSGWIQSGNRWWYRHADGSYTRNGWERIAGTWYRFDSAGWMQTGWVKDGESWYYLRDSGAMATGWISSSGTWYYLKESGAMATGWVLSGGSWYYLDRDGSMYSNRWVTSNGTWYYLDSNGGMATSRWIQTYYYVGKDGAMYENGVTPDGYRIVSGRWDGKGRVA